jgi:hypothetical protein
VGLQFIVIAGKDVEVVGELLHLRDQPCFLLFENDHVLVVGLALVGFGLLHLACEVVVGNGLEELFEFGLCDIQRTLSSSALKAFSS